MIQIAQNGATIEPAVPTILSLTRGIPSTAITSGPGMFRNITEDKRKQKADLSEIIQLQPSSPSLEEIMLIGYGELERNVQDSAYFTPSNILGTSRAVYSLAFDPIYLVGMSLVQTRAPVVYRVGAPTISKTNNDSFVHTLVYSGDFVFALFFYSENGVNYNSSYVDSTYGSKLDNYVPAVGSVELLRLDLTKSNYQTQGAESLNLVVRETPLRETEYKPQMIFPSLNSPQVREHAGPIYVSSTNHGSFSNPRIQLRAKTKPALNYGPETAKIEVKKVENINFIKTDKPARERPIGYDGALYNNNLRLGKNMEVRQTVLNFGKYDAAKEIKAFDLYLASAGFDDQIVMMAFYDRTAEEKAETKQLSPGRYAVEKLYPQTAKTMDISSSAPIAEQLISLKLGKTPIFDLETRLYESRLAQLEEKREQEAQPYTDSDSIDSVVEPKLKEVYRDGKVLEGIRTLIDDYVVNETDILNGAKDYIIKTEDSREIAIKRNSMMAILDRLLQEAGLEPIYKLQTFVNTDNGKKETALILAGIKNLDSELKDVFDGYMDKVGFLTLSNYAEPGKGTMAADEYIPKAGESLSLHAVVEGLFKGEKFNSQCFKPGEEQGQENVEIKEYKGIGDRREKEIYQTKENKTNEEIDPYAIGGLGIAGAALVGAALSPLFAAVGKLLDREKTEQLSNRLEDSIQVELKPLYENGELVKGASVLYEGMVAKEVLETARSLKPKIAKEANVKAEEIDDNLAVIYYLSQPIGVTMGKGYIDTLTGQYVPELYIKAKDSRKGILVEFRNEEGNFEEPGFKHGEESPLRKRNLLDSYMQIKSVPDTYSRKKASTNCDSYTLVKKTLVEEDTKNKTLGQVIDDMLKGAKIPSKEELSEMLGDVYFRRVFLGEEDIGKISLDYETPAGLLVDKELTVKFMRHTQPGTFEIKSKYHCPGRSLYTLFHGDKSLNPLVQYRREVEGVSTFFDAHYEIPEEKYHNRPVIDNVQYGTDSKGRLEILKIDGYNHGKIRLLVNGELKPLDHIYKKGEKLLLVSVNNNSAL